MSIIELKNISRAYGEHQVLRDFSLTVEQGDFICVSGESGAGKSTLLNIIGLLEKADSGEYMLFGKKAPLVNTREGSDLLRYKISYLFQSFALINDKTVRENLKVGLHFSKLGRSEQEEKINDVLKKIGLEGVSDKIVNNLSGGEQQRIALARVLLKPSELLLADEPTGSLDEHNRDRVMEILKTINESGKTILMVSHDPKVAEYAKKQIYITKL